MRPFNPLVLYYAFPALVLLLLLDFISAGSMTEERENTSFCQTQGAPINRNDTFFLSINAK